MKTPAFWQKPSLIGFALWPLSILYGLGVAASKQQQKPKQASLPVLSIGNATVGGTGKTPTALALMPILRALGFDPHFLTRGYQSATPLTAHRVIEQDDWHIVGDEALLLARAAPTWVGGERLTSAEAAAKAGATLAVCDDGLQHYRLHKDLSLLVIDGPYGNGNGLLLPAGPLRERFRDALARCHAIILIGEDKQLLAERTTLPVFRASLTPSLNASALAGQPWLAFAGIGRPEKFFATLRGLGAILATTRSFPDHHAYSDADFAALQEEAARLSARLITTEKDAVKLTAEHRAQVTVLPVTLTFEDEAALRQFLRDALVSYKPS